jgi:hypothetical protein
VTQRIQRIKITSHSAWQELRKQDVTASTVGALFPDVHPYLTIAGLHALKCGIEMPGPDPESDVIRRGRALEQVVADEVGRLRPEWIITKAAEYLRDPQARLGATPDFYFTSPRGRGVLQTKTVGIGKFKREWEENGAPPFWITLQLAQEAMLDGADFGAVGVVAIGDWAFRCAVYEIERNATAERRIRQAAAAFWRAVDAGQVPQLDYKRDGDLIALMFPHEVKGKTADLTKDNRITKLLETRELQSSIIKDAEALKDEAEAEIKAKVGDAASALVRGWKVTLTTTNVPEQLRPAYSFRALRTRRVPT